MAAETEQDLSCMFRLSQTETAKEAQLSKNCWSVMEDTVNGTRKSKMGCMLSLSDIQKMRSCLEMSP